MKTALITGASGGIGFAVVKKFIENGYFVVAQYNKGAAEWCIFTVPRCRRDV